MKTILLRAALALTLAFGVAGCAGFFDKFEKVTAVVTSATVSSKTIVLGIQAFDVIKVTATGYVRQRRCTGTNGPFCRDPEVTETLAAAMDEGTKARNELKIWLRANPKGFGPQSTYDKLTTATTAIEKALAVFTAATTR